MADDASTPRSRTTLYLLLAGAVVFLILAYLLVSGSAERRAYEAELSGLRGQLAEQQDLRGTADDLRAEIGTLEPELERMRGDREALAADTESATARLGQLREEAAGVEAQVAAGQEERAALEAEVAPMREEIAGFE